MNKKSIVLFVVALAILLALQIKFLLPYVYDIAASDLFLVESKDNASQMAISNDMTAIAFSHCNNHISQQLQPDSSVSFGNQPINAWSIGNYEYIINADLEITNKDATSSSHHYVCRIQYENGDDTSGANDIENWSIEGITGLPE
jgi:hypothetical protein